MSTADDLLDKEMRNKLDVAARKGCSPEAHQSLVEFLLMSHQLHLDTREDVRQIPQKVAEAIRDLKGDDTTTTLKWGNFSISGKSAVVLAVKYGSFAATFITMLYILAKIHGYFPVSASSENVSGFDKKVSVLKE